MRLRIDGILAVSPGVSGGKQWMKFANIRVIAFEFVYSIKTRPRFNSHSKVTQDLRHYYMPNGHLRSVLLPNKVQMNTFTNNLPFVEDKQTRPRFLESPVFFTCFHPEKPSDIQLLSHQSLSACKDGGYRE